MQKAKAGDGHKTKIQAKDQPPNDVQFPLREPGDKWKFFGWLILSPTVITTLTVILLTKLIYPYVSLLSLFVIGLFHIGTLLFFLWLLWLPAVLAYVPWSDRLETGFLVVRDIILILIFYYFFPHHYLLQYSFKKYEFSTGGLKVYGVVLFFIGGIIVALSMYTMKRGAFSNVRKGEKPGRVPYLLRWKLADIITQLIFLFMFIVVEFRMLLFSHEYRGLFFFEFEPWDYLAYKHSFEQFAVVACSAFLSALIWFLLGIVPNRVMNSVLITATFRERDVRGLFWKSYRYVRHFLSAVLYKSPVLPLLLATTFALLAVPIVFFYFGENDVIQNLFSADVLILFVGITSTWLGTLMFAVVHPDETFGDYFNKAISRLLLRIQDHKIYIGYGSLGKRIVQRELKEKKLHADAKKFFYHVVTPDIQLETISTRVVVVEKNLQHIVFSSSDELLGDFGVVSACEKRIQTLDPQGNQVRAETRVLVPTIIGDAGHAFSVARANMERAKQIICTVPDENIIQSVFQDVKRYSIPAILSVPRSDQLSYFIYQIRNKKITLLYPEFDSGISIGFRIFAMMKKIVAVKSDVNESAKGKATETKNAENLLSDVSGSDSKEKTTETIDPEHLPKVMLVGNNRINQYMFESIWMNIHGLLYDRKKNYINFVKASKRYFKNKFRFVMTPDKLDVAYPTLLDHSGGVFNKIAPMSLVTGSRYPHELVGNGKNQIFKIEIPSRVVNKRDILVLEKCIEKFAPDILVVSHFDSESTLMLLSRCVRSLERVKIRKAGSFTLPMVLLTSMRGSDWELISLGDASRYYNSVGSLFDESMIKDTSYPIHSFFDHYKKEHVGEGITDISSDAEEIIVGSGASLQSDNFIEINACYPNKPGSLANYLAQLAGIRFGVASDLSPGSLQKHHASSNSEENPDFSKLRTYWAKARGGSNKDADKVFFPSFQLLRNILLDSKQNGFVLTGYAALVPIDENKFDAIAEQGTDQKKFISRIHVMDGKTYIERIEDKQHYLYNSPEHRVNHDEMLKRFPEPKSPGVPDVIGQLVGNDVEKHNTIDEFYCSLTDDTHCTENVDNSDKGNKRGKGSRYGRYVCPGVAGCRISAYQNWVMASNDLRIRKYVSLPRGKAEGHDKLLHARNYHCCPDIQNAHPEDLPNAKSPFARVFFCCQSDNKPGQIAIVLNAVLFRLLYKKLDQSGSSCEKSSGQGEARGVGENTHERKIDKNWTVNINYFKDVTCLNTYFSMNRIFGTLEKRKANANNSEQTAFNFPAHLIRIVPIGSIDSMRQWYYYAKALYDFLSEYDSQHTYHFYWVDEERKSHNCEDIPGFSIEDGVRKNVPNIIVIKRNRDNKTERGEVSLNKNTSGENMCEYCHVQPRDQDCQKFRVWI